MLHLEVDNARVRVKATFWGEGSVRAETVRTRCSGIEAVLEIESKDDPEQIAKLARLSEAGCYVIQTLRNPTPVSLAVELNGQPMNSSNP